MTCIERWEIRLTISTKSVSMEGAQKEESEEEMIYLMLMKMTYTMTHVTETYLLS